MLSSIVHWIRKEIHEPRKTCNGGCFISSSAYWIKRYAHRGNSGDGSYGRLAHFKAEVINEFVDQNNISSVIEFGCGDGNQLSLYHFQNYLGLDVSEDAVRTCRERFKDKSRYAFRHIGDFAGSPAELSLSIDVIFHLVEEDVYFEYMSRLFDSSSRFVIIYSSCVNIRSSAAHVRHRNFLHWIATNRPRWRLDRVIAQRYPSPDILEDHEGCSFCDFYVFHAE